jgi:hypothetical protein
MPSPSRDARGARRSGSAPVPSSSRRYGSKWWLYAYGDDSKRWAWGGSGFGSQKPIVLPEYDLLMIFTGWNVLPNQPSLGTKVAIDRVVEAVPHGPRPRER